MIMLPEPPGSELEAFCEVWRKDRPYAAKKRP
jgi:hypothetical protein